MPKLVNGVRYNKLVGVPKDIYENYCFKYSADTMSKFIVNALSKAVENRSFLEFVLFDHADDFLCQRSVVNANQYKGDN